MPEESYWFSEYFAFEWVSKTLYLASEKLSVQLIFAHAEQMEQHTPSRCSGSDHSKQRTNQRMKDYANTRPLWFQSTMAVAPIAVQGGDEFVLTGCFEDSRLYAEAEYFVRRAEKQDHNEASLLNGPSCSTPRDRSGRSP